MGHLACVRVSASDAPLWPPNECARMARKIFHQWAAARARLGHSANQSVSQSANQSVSQLAKQKQAVVGGQKKSQSIKNATTRTMSWQWDSVWLHLTRLLDTYCFALARLSTAPT